MFFAISHAVQGVFIWAGLTALIVAGLALFVRGVPLRGRAQPEEQPAAELVT